MAGLMKYGGAGGDLALAAGEFGKNFMQAKTAAEDRQLERERRLQEDAIKKKMLKFQEIETASKLADTLGYLPKGLISEESQGLIAGQNPSGLLNDEGGDKVEIPGLIPKHQKEINLKKAQLDASLIDKGKEAIYNKETGGFEFKDVPLTGKAASDASKKSSEERFNRVSDLRKERNSLPVTKATQEMAQAFKKIVTVSKNPSPAGDMSLMYSYIKMLDPSTGIKEGELANAQNAASLPVQVRNAYNKAVSGTGLDPTQRADYLGQARNLYKSQLEQQTKADQTFKDIAKEGRLNEKHVITDFSVSDPEDEAALAWAKKNPKDGRAQQILKMHGM